jgi:allantoinase
MAGRPKFPGFSSQTGCRGAAHADSRRQPRVMGIPLHPMISGQPLRIRYLEKAIAYMQEHQGVWFTTGSEIVDAYQKVA